MSTFVWRGDQLLARVASEVDRICRKVGFMLVGRVQVDTPVDTGAARNSVSMEVDQEAMRITLRVGGTVEYYIWIEIGSRGRPGRAPLGKNFDAAVSMLRLELAGIRL